MTNDSNIFEHLHEQKSSKNDTLLDPTCPISRGSNFYLLLFIVLQIIFDIMIVTFWIADRFYEDGTESDMREFFKIDLDSQHIQSLSPSLAPTVFNHTGLT